jgi:hypothetical protein
MALSHFREKQKIIFWATAIILIPCFVVLFGTGAGRNGGGSNFPLLKIENDVVMKNDYMAFVNRMRAVNPRMNFEFSENGLAQAGILMYKVQQAKAANLNVSDEEAGTFIRRNPLFSDSKTGKFSSELYNTRLQNYYHLSTTEYRKGVDEVLLINKFDQMLNAGTVSPLAAYSAWAIDESQVTYSKFTAKADDFAKQAEGAIKDMDAEIAKAIETPEEYGLSNKDLYLPGKWRLEYIISEYNRMAVSKPSDDDIKNYFEEHKKDYKDKKLEDVKGEIAKKLLQERRAFAAERKIGEDIDSRLTALADKDIVTAQDVIKPLEKYAKRGFFTIGNTGSKVAAIPELMKLPAFAGSTELENFLSDIEVMDEVERKEKIAELKGNFNSRIRKKNLQSDQGVFKIRVLEFVPGQKKDPAKDAEFKKLIKQAVIKVEADKLAKNHAENMRIQYDSGKEEGIKFESVTQKLNEAPFASNADLKVDEATLVESAGMGSYEFYVLRGRSIPSYAEYSQLPANEREKKLRQINFMRRYGYQNYGIPPFRSSLWTNTLYSSGKIKLLYDFDHEGHDHEKGSEG